MASRATKEKIVDVQLKELVPKLGELKQQKSEIEKQEKALASQVKQLMLDANMEQCAAGGYTAKITKVSADVLDEQAAVEILESVASPELLNSIIYVQKHIDHDRLEKAVYLRELPEGVLATAITHKPPVVKLSVPKDKKPKW